MVGIGSHEAVNTHELRVNGALAQIDEIDALLDVERPSRSDTLSKAKMVQGSCGACHELYREGEFETGFRFKAGALEGF